MREMTAFVEHVDAPIADHEGELHRVADFNIDATFLGFGNHAAGAVKPRPPTEDGQTQPWRAAAGGIVHPTIGSHRREQSMTRL